MRVVAYSIKSTEKESLAIANRKKHEITLISNALSADTVIYAEGKDAVVVFTDDDVSEHVIKRLAELGVKYIATRSVDSAHIDLPAAAKYHIKIASVPVKALNDLRIELVPTVLATETINNLDKWQHNKCLGSACICSESCGKFPAGQFPNANQDES